MLAVFKRQREKKGDQSRFKCRKMVNYNAIRSKDTPHILQTTVVFSLEYNGAHLAFSPSVKLATDVQVNLIRLRHVDCPFATQH